VATDRDNRHVIFDKANVQLLEVRLKHATKETDTTHSGLGNTFTVLRPAQEVAGEDGPPGA